MAGISIYGIFEEGSKSVSLENITVSNISGIKHANLFLPILLLNNILLAKNSVTTCSLCSGSVDGGFVGGIYGREADYYYLNHINEMIVI